MKMLHLTTYTFYRPDFFGGILKKAVRHREDPFRIFVLSDIHFSYQVTDEKLQSIVNFIKLRTPKYIFLPGDIVDSLSMIEDPGEQERLLDFLQDLGRICPLLISLGNHDFYERPPERHAYGFAIASNSAFLARIAGLMNVHLLNNSSYEDRNIYVFGFTQAADYYGLTGPNRGRFLKPRHENKETMLRELDALDQKFFHDLPKQKLKFLLVHSPVCLSDPEVKNRLDEFDYFISGHMHNGVMPPVIDELYRGRRGLVSPTKEPLPNNVRNTIKTYADKSIVSGAVTTFHECTGPLHKLNALYPTYLTELKFTADTHFERRPDIERKYYNFVRSKKSNQKLNEIKP